MGQLKSQATWEELNEPLKLLERFPSVATLGDYKLDSTEVAEIHAGGITGQGIIVAVIDTGVDFNHPDLNIWRDKSGNPGWNFPDQNNDTMDKDSHGTHVAGIIAALKNSDKITGIAPDARIMPIKVIGGTRIGTSWDVALGIRYATDNGAKVINLSLGGQFTMPSVEAAITYAASNGVTVVMAAGNAGGTVPIYPAAYARDNGIAVGAIEASLSQAGFSNRAGDSEKMVYLLAPGVSIVSTVPGGRFGGKSGTSMASPVIAGCVALILSANPALTPSQIREILKQTAAHY
jgi:subtilisin family serine protease